MRTASKRRVSTIAATTAATALLSRHISIASAAEASFALSKSRSRSRSRLSGSVGRSIRRSSFVEAEVRATPRMFSFSKEDLTIFHLPSVGSTQEEARRILTEESQTYSQSRCFAVSASEQTNGRGTSGREWIGQVGNSFLTVCVPSPLISFPVTLLPLAVGTTVASRIHQFLFDHNDSKTSKTMPNVTVKWPNDVLINDDKVAGTLIEMDSDKLGQSWFLIGIGVNCLHAPEIQSIGPHRGRQATCILNHCQGVGDADINIDVDIDIDTGVRVAKTLAQSIANDLSISLESMNRNMDINIDDQMSLAAGIVVEWERWAEFGKPQVLRDSTKNEVVVPLRIEADGQLLVKGEDGKEFLLCAEYLL